MLLSFLSNSFNGLPLRERFVSNSYASQEVSGLAGFAVVFAAASTVLASVPQPVQAAPQYDLTQQAVLTSPLTGAPQPISLIYAAPQIDGTVQPVYIVSAVTPPAVVQPTVPFIQGAPQSVDLTQQPLYTVSASSRQGPTVRPIYAAPELRDLTQQALLFSPTENREGPVLRIIIASPQGIDLTQQTVFSPSAASAQGPTVKPLSAYPTIDLTQQGSIFPALVPPPVIPNPIIPTVWAAPQLDLTQPAKVWGPLALNQKPWIAQISAAPQFIDLTLPARVWAPVVKQGQPPPLVLAAPQPDLTIQGWVRGTAPPKQGVLGSFVNVSPQPDTSQLSGLVFQPLKAVTIVSGTIIPPTIIAAPQPDLTVNQSGLFVSPLVGSVPIPPGFIPAPDFTGVHWYAASKAIIFGGFNQTQAPVKVASNRLPPGYVLYQTPTAGTYVPPGCNFQLTVVAEYLEGAAIGIYSPYTNQLI